MKKNLTLSIGVKLWSFAAVLTANLIGVGVLSNWSTSILSSALAHADHNDIPLTRNLILVDMVHDGIRSIVYRAVVVSRQKDELETKEIGTELAEAESNVTSYMENMSKLDIPPVSRTKLTVIQNDFAEYLKSARETVSIAFGGDTTKISDSLTGFDEKFKGLEKDLAAFENDIQATIDRNAVIDSETILFARKLNLWTIVFGVVIGFSLSLIIIRDLQKKLRDVIQSLSSETQVIGQTSEGLNESSNDLAASTGKQASALQQTASSIEQISSMVKKTSDNSKNLEISAQESQKSAHSGQAAITQMLEAMTTISSSHTKIMSQVAEGNRKITEIVKVIAAIGEKTKVINDIVFQTKLLSFNASVEAARAGEHGKGFAVVAEEVGNLAQMSGSAAKEISEMLNSSIERVESIVSENQTSIAALITDGKHNIDSGAIIAQQCGSSLNSIVRASDEVGILISEITTAIHEQNDGVQEISKAILLLEESTQANSLTSHATSETSRRLLSQATNIKGIVRSLEMMISGKTRNDVNSDKQSA